MAQGGRSTGGTRTAPARAPRRKPEPEPAPSRPLLTDAAALRWLQEHPDVAAGLLFALFVLGYLWPVLLGGKILSPIASLYGHTPWTLAPKHVLDYYNPVLTDIPTADYPWRLFAREMIHAGTFPAWNPHVFAGTPFFSNPQTGLFTPFSLPLWILPLNYAIGLEAAIKLWFGAFGTYLLVRQLRLGFLPGLLAGVCFSFSAINITWLTHETLPAVAVMLPWIVWLVERTFERGGLGNVLGLGVVTAVALGGGHPGMQVHVLAAAGLYVALRAAFSDDLADVDRLRAAGLAAVGLVLGGLLMGIMLVPEALSSHGTIGTVARQGGHGTLPGTQMPPDALKTIAFPDWWGRNTGYTVPNPSIHSAAGTANYNERTFYAGVVALLFACIGLLTRGDWRRKGPFAVLAVLGLAIPLHAPGLYWLATHLPVFKEVQSQRLHFVYAFAAAVLAAYGLRAVLERPEEDRWRLAVPAVGVLVALVLAGTANVQAGDVGHVLDHFLTGKDYPSDGVVALTSVAWAVLFALGIGAALLAAVRWPSRVAAFAAAIVLLAAVDMYHFAGDYQPMGPASEVILPRMPAIAYLQRHVQGRRIVGLNNALINDWSTTYGFDDVRGYDPPQPTLRFFDLWRTANPTQPNWTPFEMDALSHEALKVMSVLGARYIVTDAGLDAPPRSDPVYRPVRRVYDGKDAEIFSNELAVPRAMVAPRVVVAANEDATRTAIVDDAFDPRREVVIERDEPGSGAAVAALARSPTIHGRVAIAKDENARVTLRATLDHPGLVVLNDNFTDGWSVKVDGRTAQPLHVNDAMRGVLVRAGRHEVVWSYAVPGLKAGLLLSLLGLLALGGGAIALALRSRR